MKREKFSTFEAMATQRAKYIRLGYKLQSYADPATGTYWIEITTLPTEVVRVELEGK